MLKLKVKKLDREAFRPYGDYVELLRPDSFYGDAPTMFTPVCSISRTRLALMKSWSFTVCGRIIRQLGP